MAVLRGTFAEGRWGEMDAIVSAPNAADGGAGVRKLQTKLDFALTPQDWTFVDSVTYLQGDKWKRAAFRQEIDEDGPHPTMPATGIHPTPTRSLRCVVAHMPIYLSLYLSIGTSNNDRRYCCGLSVHFLLQHRVTLPNRTSPMGFG